MGGMWRCGRIKSLVSSCLLSLLNFTRFYKCKSLSPWEALGAEGQATENLCALVELLHIGRRYHGDAAAAVGDTIVVCTRAKAHYDTNQEGEKNQNNNRR